MQFNADWFDRHIEGMGQDVLWRRSYSCTCLDPESGSPKHNHARCGGKGKIWDAPKPSRVGVPKQDTNLKMAGMGNWEEGDMVITIPRTSCMWEFAGQNDRVVMLNSTDVFSQPMKRGHISERLIFPVESINRVFWENTSGTIVEGGIPAVSNDGHLTWAGGIGEPPVGTVYSLSGQKYSEYYVYGHFPSDRNEHAGMQLPKRCVLKKLDLLNR
jgi:hypothetical protein